ncbi:MAG: flagellar hook-associated protein FlgK [Methylacidiphilales bacterium]|nr:flagellar hook-associated protein FlgK [Candidatus Methylacidiphilales bacterium]
MSFSAIRNIATSSLMATSVQVSLTSSNIANADVEGYTRKLVTQVATVTGGVGTGTAITGITSKVDKYLVKALVESTSTLGAAEANSIFANRLQDLFGQTIGGDNSENGTSLGNSIALLETALANLAATPESESLQSAVVDALNYVTVQINETASGIQALRSEADSRIAESIDVVNAALAEIDTLNDAILAAQARGDSSADLEDKRYTALQTVATKMNVSYFINSRGEMYVYAAAGHPLVDSRAHVITYDPVSIVTKTTAFNDIKVDGKDITTGITGGEIGALISQRDTRLVAVQDEIDNLAAEMIDAVNAVHNRGTSLPPPSTLTGTTDVGPLGLGEPLAAAGTVRFAVVDQKGDLVSLTDINLAGFATVGDLVSAIDGIAGLSASLDANGRLVVSADVAGTGVAINAMTSDIGGKGLSHYFGLNDLLTGTDSTTISVRADLAATPGLISSSILSGALVPLPASGDRVVTSGDETIAQGLYDALVGPHTFTAAGRLGISATSFAGYAADIVNELATSYQSAKTNYGSMEAAQKSLADSLASQSGVNIDEETARLSELQDLYAVATQILATLNEMFDALIQAARTA